MITYKKYLFNNLSIKSYNDGLREYGDNLNCLNKCLENIFPNNVFIHDKYLKINNEYVCNEFNQKIKPDYVCEKLKLIVEFDGSHHYTDPFVYYKDRSNNITLEKLGYDVVRIPYYVQLDKCAIQHYFKIDFSNNLYDTDNDHGFMHPDIVLPSFFCENGKTNFINDLFDLPIDISSKIIESIGYRLLYIKEVFGKNYKEYCDCIISKSMFDILKYFFALNKISFNIESNDIKHLCMKEVLELPIINESLNEDINSEYDATNSLILNLSSKCFMQ